MIGLYWQKQGFAIITFVALIVAQISAVESVAATTLEIQVHDENGEPVPNAVVSLPGIKAPMTKKMAVMDQIAKQFSPYVLVVQQSQAVDFPNSDNIRHHVYSFSQPNQFEIRLFSGSEAQPLSFEHAGVIVLGCNVHDNMIGYIYVNDGEITAMTDKEGRVKIELPDNLSSDKAIQANIWHPELSFVQSERAKISLNYNADLQIVELPFALEKVEPTTDTGFKSKFGE